MSDSVKAIQGLEVGRWSVNYVEPLPTYRHGRVALLGDAVRHPFVY